MFDWLCEVLFLDDLQRFMLHARVCHPLISPLLLDVALFDKHTARQLRIDMLLGMPVLSFV